MYVFLAIAVSFLCSVMEAVLLSITPAYIARYEQEKPRFGRRLKKIKDDIETPLAAILTLNTIAHTVGAAGAGAQAAHVFGDEYVGVISAVLTILILVFSEIIPKTIGALYWKQLVPATISLIKVTVLTTYPLVKLTNIITRFLSRNKKKTYISHSEVIALAEMGIREGVFYSQESKVLRSLFELRNLSANDIMTPRTVLTAFDENLTVEDIFNAHSDLPFSRIPVYSDNIDSITGFVLKVDIFLKAAEDKHETKLVDIRRDIMDYPEWVGVYKLFEELVKNDEHIALMVDEYGGTAGIVTLEDIIETLIGAEITDETDYAEDMQEVAREQWKERSDKNSGEIIDE